MVQPGATDAFGEIAGIKAELNGLALDLIGNLARYFTTALDQFLMRINLVFDKGACWPRSSHVRHSVRIASSLPLRPQGHVKCDFACLKTTCFRGLRRRQKFEQ